MVTNATLSYTVYMSIFPHLYHPSSSELKERIRSFKIVLDSYRNLEASLKTRDDQASADRLGTPDELSEAKIIISNSLDMAAKSLQKSEIQQAQAKGWLDSEDTKLITRLDRLNEMKAQRQQKQGQSDSQKQRFKR